MRIRIGGETLAVGGYLTYEQGQALVMSPVDRDVLRPSGIALPAVAADAPLSEDANRLILPYHHDGDAEAARVIAKLERQARLDALPEGDTGLPEVAR